MTSTFVEPIILDQGTHYDECAANEISDHHVSGWSEDNGCVNGRGADQKMD